MDVSVGATLFVRFGGILHQMRMPDTIHDIPLQRPRELAEEIISYAAPQA
jgi:hypothetical protein